MHIEIQVALNFVISYLYNKLPRRRVNLFGEELEKALKEKFVGHWYPEKPFKGSAFRCLKTGDPTDAVLDRAARESGVPISDILENLPAELSVWIDPGEVSYRIGEKGPVKILYSEINDSHEDYNADREVTKTFNPEAQCFRPIEIVSNGLNGLTLNSKPHDVTSNASSPMYKTNAAIETSPAPTTSFLNRSQEPLTFTTATFAQTKFGSTKLKNNSKRTNRMSPTEFSNYLKQRGIQQQIPNPIGQPPNNHFGPIGSISPSRSISPNSFAVSMQTATDPKHFFSNLQSMQNMYPGSGSNGGGTSFGGSPRGGGYEANFMGGPVGATPDTLHLYTNGPSSNTNKMQQQQTGAISPGQPGNMSGGGVTAPGGVSGTDSKLMDGLNTYYSSNAGSYHHLLVAN